MAVGVPEAEVFAAADAVLARGERPTVERVRIELGRGSPARVGSLLDQWWDRLAQRLRSETRLPALPPEVSQAFVAIWQQAVRLAGDVAQRSLDDQRQVLMDETVKMLAIEDAARQEAAQYRQQAATAIAHQQVAERRLADLERLLEQGLRQIEDLTQQRDGLQQDRDAGRERIQSLDRQLLSDRYDADQARKAQEAYIRGVEERAHREVDRAREETKAVSLQVKQLEKQAEVLQRRLEEARLQVSQAQHLAATHQADGEREARQAQQMQAKLHLVQAELEEVSQRAAAQQAKADILEQQLTLHQQFAGGAEVTKAYSRKQRKSLKPEANS
jgi:chromosome segregation ATPase